MYSNFISMFMEKVTGSVIRIQKVGRGLVDWIEADRRDTDIYII